MILIGITGAIGHGKTSLADAIADIEPYTVHLESGLIITEVIDYLQSNMRSIPAADNLEAVNSWLSALPKILKEVVNIKVDFDKIKVNPQAVEATPEQFQKLFIHLETLQNFPELVGQRITPANKPQFRAILQWVGGYIIAKTDSNVWFREVVRRSDKAAAAGVSICVAGGLRSPDEADLIHKASGYVVQVIRPDTPELDISDATENKRILIRPDTTLSNDGSLDTLRVKAGRLLADMCDGFLAPTY